ncbi:protein transport protein Sec61 subunit gamma isoform X1 [Gastrolobium bilobum]|uniref:protein transport protein Sec61 subunit gamma isoform X1 n=2 Tax=NPAAA clade TaxID=2231382 RepID=UPI002AB090CA|nr:protein transport protein Sec61 subunit gamma isoform X1 [Gastrolobium bilobum]
MEAIDSVFDPLREFAKDSVRLVKRCHKPDRKEFSKVAVRTAIGFVVMGFVGFFVKLIFIPINNIIVGSGWGTTLASGIQVVKQKEAERVATSIYHSMCT